MPKMHQRSWPRPKVVWHACDLCGQDWPFPEGVPAAVDPETHERRDWHCAVCVYARWASIERSMAKIIEIVGNLGGDTAVEAIVKEWR